MCPRLSSVLHHNTYADCSAQHFLDSICTINCRLGTKMPAGSTPQIKCVDTDSDGVGNWDAVPPSCEGW